MRKHLLILALMACSLRLFAATYYVDFDTGSDSNNGTTTSTPFKYHPDDNNATGNANIVLAAGDIVYLKGGVNYCSRLNFQSSGTTGSRIVLDSGHMIGWGTGKAVIDGTTNLTWTACTAEGTGATQVQNAGFASIYYATLPSGSDWTITMIEDTNVMWICGSPNTSDWFRYNNTDYFQAIASGISQTSLTDASFLSSADANYWVGGVVVFHATGNSTGYGVITNFNTGTDTVTYGGIGTPYQASDWDNNYHYTIINSQRQLVRGSYAVDTAGGRILCWPTNNIANVRVGVLPGGIHTEAQSYRTIQNICVRGHYGTAFINGRYITANNSTGTEGNLIQGCEFYGGADNGATAGIFTLSTDAGVSNNVVRNNLMRFSRGRGIFGAGNGFIFQSNELHRVTGTVLYSLAYASRTNRNGKYLDNYIHDCNGTHANGMTVYGVGVYTARSFEIARNRVIRQYQRYGPFALSLQIHSDIQIENNVLDGNIADDGSYAGAYMRWLNNTITGTLRIYDAVNVTDCVVKNNLILNGLTNDAGESWGDIDYQYNIYTNLTSRQDAFYSWTIGTGESTKTIAQLWSGGFTDGTITDSSSAYNTGTDVSSDMVYELDAILTVRPQATSWDIGAYEYQAGGGSTTYRGFSFGSGVKLIGAGRVTQ